MNRYGAVALSVVAALAMAWFWFRSNDATTSSPPETPANKPDLSATETATSVPSAATVEDNASEPQESPAATQDERDANEAKKVSDAFERGVTPTFVDYLVSKGASREDSERIVAEGMREVASCVLDTVRARGSTPAAPLGVKAGNPPAALPGLLFSDRTAGCMESVYQRIGLPPRVTYELRLQGETFEIAAQVLPE
jgi:hypothetical protein